MNNICIECSTAFESTRPSKFCSDACRQRNKYKYKKANGISPYLAQKQRGLTKKINVVKSLGGKCSCCGYNKNLSALEFHHTDPSVKDFTLDLRVFSNLSDDNLNKEILKCVLLCANCHRELHNPDKENWDL